MLRPSAATRAALPGVSRSQAVQHQRKMQHDQVETAVNRVGDRIVAVKAWQSRLRHDHAIQGRNGGRLSVAAKEGEYHRFDLPLIWACLLYTSDAADDLLCVDLGGR